MQPSIGNVVLYYSGYFEIGVSIENVIMKTLEAIQKDPWLLGIGKDHW